MTPSERGDIIPFPGGPEIKLGLRFRVELLLVPSPVWRLILVPEAYSFWDLHVAIQDAMGWEDRHLHQFTLDQPGRGERLRFGIPDPGAGDARHQVRPGWEARISDFFRPDLPAALYTYDFGDNWQHEVSLEGYGPAQEGLPPPACLGGEGICPPEDCGGPLEFARLAAAAQPRVFRPADVVFANPQQRWERAFRYDK